jgi:hypothetical protein
MHREDINRLEAFEIRLPRQTTKVNWTEHRTNEEELEMVQGKNVEKNNRR